MAAGAPVASAGIAAKEPTLMRLSHINVTLPEGCEDLARAFYGAQFGLREIVKPGALSSAGRSLV